MRHLIAFLLLCSCSFAATPSEVILIASARAKWALSQRKELPDKPPNLKLNNFKTGTTADSGFTEYRVPHATGWVMNGGHASVGHVIEHGCPVPVANYYRNNPTVLDQIHSGYHEQERGGKYGVWVVKVPSVESVAEKPVMKSLPVFKSQGGCPPGGCPTGPGRTRRGLFGW